MPRKPRIHYEGALYHVIVRGNNREYIFKEDAWKKEYLEIIQRYKNKYGFKLYAYVIMDNHIHLLIEVNHVPLSKVMQCVQQVFTQSYNRKTNRTGHVFEQRYKSILCDKDQYLLGLIRYIHQNPVRIGHDSGLKYKWSSYKDYIKDKPSGLSDIEFPLSLFDNRIDRFKVFMNEEDDIHKKKVREFSEDIDEHKKVTEQRKEELSMSLDEIVKKVCELLKIDVVALGSKTRNRNVTKGRKLIAVIATKNPEITQTEIAKRFNQGQNSVSSMLSKEDLNKRFRNEIESIVIIDA